MVTHNQKITNVTDNQPYISMSKVSNNYNILKVVDFQDIMQIYTYLLTSTLNLLEEQLTSSPPKKKMIKQISNLVLVC